MCVTSWYLTHRRSFLGLVACIITANRENLLEAPRSRLTFSVGSLNPKKLGNKLWLPPPCLFFFHFPYALVCLSLVLSAQSSAPASLVVCELLPIQYRLLVRKLRFGHVTQSHLSIEEPIFDSGHVLASWSCGRQHCPSMF